MKRWGLLLNLGLLGLMGCAEEELPPPPPAENPASQACPGTEDDPTQQGALPGLALAHAAAKATSDAAPEQAVLVRFNSRASSPMRAMASHASAVQQLGVRGAQPVSTRLELLSARVTPSQRRALEAHPDVLFVEEDRPVRALGLPRLANSLLKGNTLALPGEYTEGLRMVQAPQVWDANGDGVLDSGAPAGQGIKVCVIDSGWDDRHPELKSAYVGGYDFVENDADPRDFDATTQQWGGGHGTHVAGTILAQLGNGGSVSPGADANGVAGVAPGARLLVARVLDTKGNGSTSNVIRAMEWCQQEGARIASLSLGSAQESVAEREAFAKAWADGLLSIAASGNDGKEDATTSPPIAFPARYPDVMAVGAVKFDSTHATFSQYGPELELAAPGVGVLSSSILGSSSYSLVNANGSEFESKSLEYATVGEYSGALVDCGLADSATACGPNRCGGFVAYVDRGGITFADKVKAVRRQGARAVIIGNNKPDTDGEGFTLGSPGRWMPVAMVSQSSGASIKALAERDATVRLVGVDYESQMGTSMATPHVSGVAALVLSAKPTLTNVQVREILQNSAKDLGTTAGRDSYYGFGLVQACKALELATGTAPSGCSPIP